MEDEQGEAARADYTAGEKLPGDPFLENMGGEFEYFEEGIMIEIVGSDVFVNGVGGEKEGNCLGFEDVPPAWEEIESTMGGFEKGELGHVVVAEDEAVDKGSDNNQVSSPEIGNSADSGQLGEGEDYVTSLEASCLSDAAQVNNTKGGVFVTHSPKAGVLAAEIFQESILKREADVHEGDISEMDKDNVSTENVHLSKPMDTEDGVECVEKHDNGEKMAVDLKGSVLETEEPISETDNLNSSNLLNQGHFVPSELVWGEVRSRLWWPGQIFDPSDASEKAARQRKKDSYLVAYFGDRSFGWNEKSKLKSFGPHFSEMEKQSNSISFQKAVTSALEEVSRRVELGLSCSCVPRNVYAEIESLVVENTGIESSRRHSVDHSSQASKIKPDEFVNYLRNLASCPFADRLDLVIAQAHLSAFVHFKFKGYPSLTEFNSSGEMLEDDVGSGKRNRRKQARKIVSHTRRKRSPVGFTDKDESSGKQRKKALEPQADEVNKSAANISYPKSPNQTKPQFKIVECISRTASRMTGPTPSVKVNNINDEIVTDDTQNNYEPPDKNQSGFVIDESFSTDEMLAELQSAAQKPEKGEDLINDIHNFFMGFRSSNKQASEKKDKSKIGVIGEEFKFDDVKGSHRGSREKSVKLGHGSRPKKRFSDGMAAVESKDEEIVKKRNQESSPAELILNFDEKKCIPLEIQLNKTLRRFGPLMESETEVNRDLGRARVIFKRGCDADVALSSAEKFSIFGPGVVTYQICYEPLISVKIVPLAVPQCQEDGTLMM